MTLLAPWFLIGLFAVGIPLLLHLRRSRRANRIVFSTTQFFDDQFMRSARRAKLQDLLLMMLRMALLAALILALAQPLIRAPGVGAWLGMGTSQTVAIVIDDSASMNAAAAASAGSAGGTLLERSKAAATALLDELSPDAGDRATVVLAGLREGGPTVLFDEPTGDFAAVRRAIESVEATDLGTDLEAAVSRAASLVGGGSAEEDDRGSGVVGGRVYVFSDAQLSALRSAGAMDVGPTVGVVLATVRPGEAGNANAAGNVSVDAVQYGSSRPMVGVPFTFRTLLTNHGRTAGEATVRLVVGDETLSERTVDLPADRGKIVRFTHRFADAGWFDGRIEVEASDAIGDAIPGDNRRHFAVRVEDRVRLLAVSGAPSNISRRDELFFFRTALAAGGRLGDESAGEGGANAPSVLVDRTTPESFDPDTLDRYPLLVLANVPSLDEATVDAIERYVDRGGGLLITLGDRVEPGAYNRWVGDHRLHGGLLPGQLQRIVGGRESPASPVNAPDDPSANAPDDTPDDADASGLENPGGAGRSTFVVDYDPTHPVLAGFDEGSLGGFSEVRFDRWFDIRPVDADVLLLGAGGSPLLLEKPFGRGRVMLFASSIDRDWTGFPLEPTFVPWAFRTVSYLAQSSGTRDGFLRTGTIASLPAAITQSETIAVTRPDGTTGYAQPGEAGRGEARFAETQRAGVYRVEPQGDDPSATGVEGAAATYQFAANPPAGEAVSLYLDADRLADIAAPGASIAMVDTSQAMADAGGLAAPGYAAWDLLLMLALIAGLAEPWIANRLSRRRAAKTGDAMSRRDVLPQEPSLPRAA
ncbi:MAG: BatA domain-containing protein [Phycisphaeraceae bacterium]